MESYRFGVTTSKTDIQSKHGSMIDGSWIPLSEEEWQLMEDLHVVTRSAHKEDGVSKARICSLLAFMAAAGYQSAPPQEVREMASQPVREEPEPEGIPCPECGSPIEKLVGGWGAADCPKCGETITDREIIEELTDAK